MYHGYLDPNRRVVFLHFGVRILSNDTVHELAQKECIESVEHGDAKDNPQSFVYRIFWASFCQCSSANLQRQSSQHS
jgi:hypothetical protein